MARRLKTQVIALLAVALLASCGDKVKTVKKDQSTSFQAACPDPDERSRLVEGATWRDLALSRAEAVAGWRACYDAVAISS